MFVAKIDASGNWVWSASGGGTGADSAAGVAVNANGDVFVVGNFRSTTASFGAVSLNNAGGSDAVVAKLDNTGSWVWATSVNGLMDETFYGCALDSNGNVLVAGHSASPSLTLGTDTLAGAGGADLLVGKLDPNGNWIWARSAGGTGNDYVNAAGIDANGDLRIAGYFQSATLDFGVTNVTRIAPNEDAVIAKIDSSGNWVWVSTAGGASAWGISVSASGEAAVAVNTRRSPVNFGVHSVNNSAFGFAELIAARIDNVGVWTGAISAGGSRDDETFAIGAGPGGVYYLGGAYQSQPATFGPISLPSSGTDDAFVARLSPAPLGTPPSILAQPQPIAQITGSSVSLAVTANGSLPLSYQWFFTNGPVPFATGPSLSFPAAQPTNSGDYFVVITNAFGSITSAPALLTITNSTAPPVLTLQPQSQSVIVSNTVVLTTTATGVLPLSYQWFFNSNLLGGATSPTLTLPNVQASQAGTYFLVVTNNFGSITSAAATLLVITSPPPPFQWIVPGGSTNTDFSGGIAADAAGNSYFAGSFQGTATFGNASITALGTSFDALFAKLDSAGNVVWLRQDGSGSGVRSDRGNGVTVDAAGNVYGCGRFEGAYQLGASQIFGQGGDEGFAVKFNSNGVRQWIKGGGGGGDDQATALAVDGGGNLFLVGNLQGGPTFNSARFDTITVTNRSPINGSFNGYVAKYNPAGTIQWVFSYGGTTNNTLTTGVGVDAAGNAYVVGTFTGTIEFGTNTVTYTAGGTFTDGFLAKVTPGGAVAWVRSFPRLSPAGINVRADGTCYVTGRFGGTQTLGPDTISAPANGSVFVAKFDPTGAPVWARQATAPGNSITGAGLAVDAQENVFISGHFNTGVTFGGTTLTNAGLQDIFVAKYDRNGAALWAKRAGGTGDDFAAGIAADGTGNAYLAGSHFTNANFDVLTLQATPDGDRSFFITKLTPAGGPVPVPTGLVGWWAGDGNTLDYAFTNHAVSTNLPFGPGLVQQAFSYSGTNNVFRVPAAPALNVGVGLGFTVELWLNLRTNQPAMPLVEWHDLAGTVPPGFLPGQGGIRSHLWVNHSVAGTVSPGSLYVNLISTTGANFKFNTPTNVIGTQTWHHVAMTYSQPSGTLTLYADGNVVLVTNLAGNPFISTSDDLLSGYRPTGVSSGDYLDGLLDELSLYNRVLTPTELQSIVAAGPAGKARPAMPILLTQPRSQTVFQGAQAQFDITAIGYGPFAYQWRLNGTNLPGQTNASVAYPGAYSVHEGTYDVRVTQQDGVSVLSSPATLNVLGQGEAKTLFGTTNDVNNFVRSAGGPSQWTLTSSNAIQVVPGTGNIQSTQSFGDFILHAEFLLPAAGNGNCGIFLQGRYEVQIFNSFGVTVLGSNDCGAIWGQIPPSTNACRPAGQWQTYDIIFRQPQWNGNTKVADARATVVLNGVTVQNNVAITNRTSASGLVEGPTPGPVVLQDNGTAVQFRNIQITPLDTPPEFQSAQSSGGSGIDQLDSLFVDQPGNSYIAGRFTGTATIAGTTLVSAGLQDNYVAKLGPNGNPLWVRQIGSTGDDAGHGVVAIPNGDVYTSGRFVNTASFGTTNLTSVGQSDIYLAKYDGNGTLIWARKAGGTGSDAAYAVTADAAGNAYITGDFSGTADFGGVQLTSGAALNSFVAKYDPTGALVWVVRIGGTGTPTAKRITLDGATNLYVGGSFQGDVQFGTLALTSAGQNDGFVLKLNSSGVAQWVQQFGGVGDDTIRGVSVAPDGTINVGGIFQGTVTLGTNTLASSGGYDAYLAKLDSGGNPLWARKAGSSGVDSLDALATDPLGAIYAVGAFAAQATFNATSLANSGTADLFVAKYDANGRQQWVHRAGNANSLGSIEVGTDAAGVVRITGQFSGALSLDSLSLTNAGQQDIFIAALGTTPPVINQQPLGGNVLAGQNVTFTVGATGTGGVTYQWRLNGTNIVDATNASYTLTNAAANAAGTYDALVTHAFGSIASSPAVVTVISSANPLPFTFAAQPIVGSNLILNEQTRDAAGNYYLVGRFTGTLTLGVTNLTSAGAADAFVVKTDATGAVLWAANFGGPSADEAAGVTVTPGGDVVAVGWFDNGAMFGTNGPVTVLSPTLSAFTVRLSPGGQLLWFQQVFSPTAPTSALQRNFQVVSDAAGNVFVAGKGQEILTFSGGPTITRQGGWAYLIKYDPSGGPTVLLTTDDVPGFSQAMSRAAVTLDTAGNIYFAGLQGQNGRASSISGINLPVAVGIDAFIGKFTSGGSPVWVRSISGPGDEFIYRLAAAPDGGVYGLGTFNAAFNFGTGTTVTPADGTNTTAVLLKLAPSGTPSWAQAVSPGGGVGGLTTDALGSAYVGTAYTGTNLLGSPPAVSTGGTDVLVTKFSAGGSFLWTQTFGGTASDSVGGLQLDANYNLHLGGMIGGGTVTVGSFSVSGNRPAIVGMASIPPVIAAQPLSQTISVNQPVTFSVGLTGTLPFSYQWRFNGTNLPGATNATLTIPTVVPASAGGYSVLVGDALGIVASEVATLTVDTSGTPFIVTPPQSQTVQQGTAVLFNVGAVGASPLSYQWRKNGTNLVGQNFSFLALGSTTTNDNGSYAVVVTNVFGAVTSAPAVLAITQIFPPVITNPPVNVTVMVGANATFSVGVGGTAPFNYQWVRGGVALPGNDAPTLTLTNVTLADAGTYFVQVFNSAGLASSQSQPATLTVLAPPALLTQPQPATVLQGGTTNFSVSVTGSPTPALAWFRDGVRLVNSVGYSGVNTTNLLVFNAQGPQAGSYYVIATNTAGAITSAPVALTVLLAPVITAQPTNVILTRTNLADVLPASLSVAATGAPPLLFQWRFNGADLPAETNAVLTLTNVTRLQNGLYQALVANVAGAVTSSAALVRVRVPQRVEPPVFVPGQPFRLRFTDDTGEQATPADLAKIEVQAATNLVGPGILWVTLTNGFSVVNGVVQFDDPASTNMIRRYYRIIEK